MWRWHPGALDTLVQRVEPMGMVSAELALPLTCRHWLRGLRIDCMGVILLDREEKREWLGARRHALLGQVRAPGLDGL